MNLNSRTIANQFFALRCDGALMGLIAICLMVVKPAHAQTPGALDAAFGGDGAPAGVTVVNFPNGFGDRVFALALQDDGKVVVAGETREGSWYDFALARLNPDGSLDETFDKDGRVVTDIVVDDSAYALVIQPDGKIVAGGTAEFGAGGAHRWTLVRYNTDGSLDDTFGVGGIVTDTSFGGRIFGMALQPDGKIVAVGTGGSGNPLTYIDFGIARFMPDGSLDTTFDGDGKTFVEFGSTNDDYAYAVALQADGKIVVTGTGRIVGGSDDFAIVRLNTDGALDNTFSGDGKALYTITGSPDVAYAIDIQSDGKIVVAGEGRTDTNSWSFALLRVAPNGDPDPTFGGGDGIVTTNFPGFLNDRAFAVRVQTNGKIVAAGQSTYKYALARYLPDGSLDLGFGGGGKVLSNFGDTGFRAMALQSDGKIVGGGGTSITGGGDMIIARYHGDPISPPAPVLGDVTADGMVNVDDLLAVINAWGDCPTKPEGPPKPQACPADLNSDQAVNVDDLLIVINNWS